MTELTLYNTLTRQKEVFTPLDTANIGMYVCGPTVYDFAHLGNARPVVVFDVLFRLLQRRYGKEHVTYVRNITDIDDKIMNRAKESGEAIASITARTTKAYQDDMAALNALPPTHEPRATEHVPDMIAMIETLIAKEHAYVAEGHVLFSVPSMANYGALSRLSRDELIAGARVDVAPYKKDPADFVLWKPSTPEQVGWDSPWINQWGKRGRPGWHIECSAMAEKLLSEAFDIHCGGLDLRFPHHENEIAQSCCAHDGKPLAKFWLHNGFLSINGEKMSKSLGNFFTVRDLLAKYPGEVIRLVLLSTHYRKPLDFTDAAMEQAKARLDSWYRALQRVASIEEWKVSGEIWIERYLLEDINTPVSISEIDQLVAKINGIELEDASDEQRNDISMFRSMTLQSAEALGLLQHSPEAWFKWQPEGQTGLSDAEIDALIAARLAARQSKNFAEADRIRKELADNKIILEDAAGVTTWRRG